MRSGLVASGAHSGRCRGRGRGRGRVGERAASKEKKIISLATLSSSLSNLCSLACLCLLSLSSLLFNVRGCQNRTHLQKKEVNQSCLSLRMVPVWSKSGDWQEDPEQGEGKGEKEESRHGAPRAGGFFSRELGGRGAAGG